ncbi:MAG: hypothetical protein V4505_07040 [Pseudomonadota bacterium]
MATPLELQQLYLAYFGRPPEPAALTYYANMTVAQVEAAFDASAEAKLVYNHSNGQADAAMVATAYVHLFGRVPTDIETQYWVDAGRSLGLSQSALSIAITGAAQGSDSTVATNRMAYVQQWVDTFSTMAKDVNFDTAAATALAQRQLANINTTPASLANATSVTVFTLTPPVVDDSGPPAPSNIFTTGTDHLSTTDGSIVYTATLGAGATLTAGDSLHGNGNRLNITDTDGTTPDAWPTGLDLSGLNTISLTTAGNAGTSGVPLDMRFDGTVQNLVLTASGTGSDYLRGGTAALKVDTQAGSVNVVSGFGSLDLTANHLTGATALSLAGTGGAVTLHDSTGATALTVALNAVTLTGGITDADNHITSLTLAGTSNLSKIDAVTDTALTSLTVTGKVVLGTSMSARFVLGANVTTLDLSGDTALGTDGKTFLQATGTGSTANYNLGGRTVNFDMNNTHSGAVITVGSAASYVDANVANAPVVLLNVPNGVKFSVAGVAGLTHDSTDTTSNAGLALAAAHSGNAYWGYSGANTYLVESATGTLGSGDTTYVLLSGHHSFSLIGGFAVLGAPLP